MTNIWKIYWKLFASTFVLSAFTFGGGYIIIPLMRKKFVTELKWIGEQEMLDITALAQSSPGAIAVNASILIGYQVAGLPGVLIAICGTVLPPFIILSVISAFYTAFCDNIVINAILKGMQAGIAAIIVDVILTMGGNLIKEKEVISIVTMLGAFITTYFFKVNVIYIIIVCGIIGAVTTIFSGKIKQGGK